GFLADKGGHGLLQFRIGDLVAVVAHGVDKEALAHREEQAHGVEELGHVHAGLVPVGDLVGRQLELDVTTVRQNGNRHGCLPLVIVTSLDVTVESAICNHLTVKCGNTGWPQGRTNPVIAANQALARYKKQYKSI